jgi:hypothetical protein
MEKKLLQEEIEKNKSISELASRFNKSKSSIRHWLKKFSLKTKYIEKYSSSKCEVCEKPLKNLQRKYCSNSCKVKSHYNKVKNNPNTTYSQEKRGIERKIYFINLLGGGCSKCGYNKNITAIEFHHKNPKEKKIGLNMRTFSNNSMNVLIEEALKCELLCANCHREYHNPRFNS